MGVLAKVNYVEKLVKEHMDEANIQTSASSAGTPTLKRQVPTTTAAVNDAQGISCRHEGLLRLDDKQTASSNGEERREGESSLEARMRSLETSFSGVLNESKATRETLEGIKLGLEAEAKASRDAWQRIHQRLDDESLATRTALEHVENIAFGSSKNIQQPVAYSTLLGCPGNSSP